jgi:hypothetical protein
LIGGDLPLNCRKKTYVFIDQFFLRTFRKTLAFKKDRIYSNRSVFEALRGGSVFVAFVRLR